MPYIRGEAAETGSAGGTIADRRGGVRAMGDGSRLRVGIRVPACRAVDEVAEYLGRIERAGFDFAGLLDSQLVSRDIFATMTAGALATSRLGLWASVLNPLTRHVSVLAGASVSVAEVAAGRAVFVMGSGYSSAKTIGERPATVATMRDAILRYQALMEGAEVDFGDTRSRLQFSPSSRPAVYVAATGPRMLELAGEVGDGVLLASGVHPRLLERAREHIARGAARAGRDMEDLDVVLYVRTIVDDDRDAAREHARLVCAQWVADEYRAAWLRLAGIDVPARSALPSALWELYPDIVHAEDPEAARRATAFLSEDLVAEICEAVGVIGTPADCVRSISALADDGIGSIYLMTADTYAFPDRVVASYSGEILPALASVR